MLCKAGYGFVPYSDGLAGDLLSVRSKLLGIYSGTIPSATQLGNAVLNNGEIDWTTLRAALSDRVLIAHCNITTPIPATKKGTDHISIPLGALDIPLTITSSGTPTWFIYGQVRTGSINGNPETATGLLFESVIVGSVGDENSSADLKIIGGTIAVGGSYTPMDIILKM